MDSLSSSDQPSSGPYPGEQGSRLSGAWTAMVVGVVTLLVILVFILQNLQSVELHFLAFHGQLPLAIALLFAAILGAIIVLAFGGGRILQLRSAKRTKRLRLRLAPHRRCRIVRANSRSRAVSSSGLLSPLAMAWLSDW